MSLETAVKNLGIQIQAEKNTKPQKTKGKKQWKIKYYDVNSGRAKAASGNPSMVHIGTTKFDRGNYVVIALKVSGRVAIATIEEKRRTEPAHEVESSDNQLPWYAIL